MSRQLEKMYKDIFTGRGIIPCEPVPGFNPNGKFYKMNPELGRGYCWVYQCNPYVTENHQEANATSLVEKDAATMILENE